MDCNSISQEDVGKIINKIVEVSKPRKVVLFGSYVAGKMGKNSDLDILVVSGEEIDNPRKESIRIRRELKGIGIPMDILVVTESRLKVFGKAPGLIYREVMDRGKVVYESAE